MNTLYLSFRLIIFSLLYTSVLPVINLFNVNAETHILKNVSTFRVSQDYWLEFLCDAECLRRGVRSIGCT